MKSLISLLILAGCVPVHILPTRTMNTETVYSLPPMLSQPTVVLNPPDAERARVMEAIKRELRKR